MPETGAALKTFVVGVGYTGSRLLDELPDGVGVSRGDEPDFGPLYDVVYTAPPLDGVLQNRLAKMEPPPQRLVYISTSGVYGDCGTRLVNETAAPAPISDRAKKRVAAEEALHDWSLRTAVDLIVLRVPGIYGPGRLGIEGIKSGARLLVEADANPGNRIHVDDLVRCCLAALSPEVPAGIYNVGDGDARSRTWFMNEVARQCGLDEPPTISREEAEKTFPKERLSFLTESRRLDLRKMRDVLGITPKYRDATAGIAASIDES
jgi:nucleoside-diphosphate-sugar epimerase